MYYYNKSSSFYIFIKFRCVRQCKSEMRRLADDELDHVIFKQSECQLIPNDTEL